MEIRDKDLTMTPSDIHNLAHKAGQYAAEKVVPTPMIVGEAVSLFSNEIDYSKPTYVVDDGPCGFAWVNIKPAYSKFAKYICEKGIGRRNTYEGGVSIWISAYNQSMVRKEAYAYAYAKVLREHGIKAYSASRLD